MERENDAFDALFSSGNLKMMKILLPCLPEDKRGGFAVFIRMQELLYTMDFVRNAGSRIHMTNAPSGDALMDALLPYCNPSQEETLRKMKDMMRQMDKLRETMEMARQMQELFPEGENIADVDLEKIMELFMQTGNK